MANLHNRTSATSVSRVGPETWITFHYRSYGRRTSECGMGKPAIFETPPQTLYKYTSRKGGVCVLRDCKIKVTPPNELNDTRELLNAVSDRDLKERLKRKLPAAKDSFVRSLREGGLAAFPDLHRRVEETADSLGFAPGTDGRKAFMEVVMDYLASDAKMDETLASLVEPGSEYLQEELPQALSVGVQKTYSMLMGIFSLSADPLNEAMWGSYAESQGGMVVGFRTDHSHFRNFPAHRVTYSNARPDHEFGAGVSDEERVRNFVAVATTKVVAWSAEKEWRQIVPLDACEHMADANIFLLSIDPGLLTSITVGPAATPEFESEIRELLKAPGLRHVALKKIERTPKKWVRRLVR